MLSIILFLGLFEHHHHDKVQDTVSYKGHFEQGGLVEILAPKGSTVSINDEEIDGFDNKYFIGFGRDAPATATLHVTYSDGKKEDFPLNIEQRQYEIQHVNGVSDSIVNPTPEQSQRIGQEALDIGTARHEADYPCPESLNFTRPAPGLITSWFGSERVYNGIPGRPHSGIDFKGNEGDPAYAPESGKVIYVDNMLLGGKTVAIDHGCGIVSTLMHLSAAEVKEGDEVKKGQIVARIGKTGIATGAHLHWGINIGSTRLDPLLLLQ